MINFDFTKPPKDAIDHLRSKGYKLTFDYDELTKQAHHKAFTVAKVTRIDILHDIFNSFDKAISNGQTFKDFQKDIKPTLQKKGWWGEKEIINPSTGEIKKIKVDSHRLRNIYKTNMRVAYSKQRYDSKKKLTLSVYWRYKSALLENTRIDHRAAHGTVFHKDNPWWNTNYPPNGWGCVCKVQAYSKKQIEKKGWKVTDKADDNIASKDWDYNPADTSKISKLSKINLDNSLASLSTVKSIRKDKYKDLSEQELEDKFYKTLDVKKGALFVDKVNDPMIIDNSLFTAASGHSKIKKQDRHLYLDEISETIKNPDEIYLYFNEQKKTLEKKMFRYYKGEGGGQRAIQVIFEYLEDKTQGVTAYFIKDTKQVSKRRFEKLIYSKE